ncbi:MAG TPA: multicopper oxidase family protein [Solirubrobacteraceae bacterium]|nr:multicopper oxidase family protein [Solirubrobacteraceae bacterium]
MPGGVRGQIAVATAAAIAVAALLAPFVTGAPAGARTPEPAQAAATDCHAHAPPLLHDGFPEPPLLYSRDGRLDVKLRAAAGPARMGRMRVNAWSYDGSVPGPTMVICAGDHVTVHLENELPEATNLHTHGFHVSPEGNSDNIFLRVEPHQQFTYEYDIPGDMSPGSYWYHPHVHMHVENQIFQGLAGAIVEEGGPLDTLPAMRHIPQRWIVLENTEVRHGRVLAPDESTETGSRVYVNGTLDPTAKIRPGQLQRWRIFNASADRVLVLRMSGGPKGGSPFLLLAEDGHTLARARSVRTLMIAPSSRREVLVRGGPPGSYALKAIPFAQFPGGEKAANGGPVPNQTLLTVRSAGRAMRRRAPTGTLSHPEDLRGKPVARERTIQFSEMVEPSGVSRFELNGMTFDPNRTDVTMKLDSIEKWTLVNTTHEWHTFHMHIDDFQVVSRNGIPVPYVEDADNVAIAPGSRTVVLIEATDFTGRFVFHCHVTLHEDRGMMATIEVVREPSAAASRSSVVRHGGLAISSSAYGYPATGHARGAPPALGEPPLFWCDPRRRRGRAA